MYIEKGCFLVECKALPFHKQKKLSTVSPSDHCHGFTAAFSDFALTKVARGYRLQRTEDAEAPDISKMDHPNTMKQSSYLSNISNTVSDMHGIHARVFRIPPILSAIVARATAFLDNTFHHLTAPYNNPQYLQTMQCTEH